MTGGIDRLGFESIGCAWANSSEFRGAVGLQPTLKGIVHMALTRRWAVRIVDRLRGSLRRQNRKRELFTKKQAVHLLKARSLKPTATILDVPPARGFIIFSLTITKPIEVTMNYWRKLLFSFQLQSTSYISFSLSQTYTDDDFIRRHKSCWLLFESEIGKLLIRYDPFIRRNEEIEKRKETKVWSNVNDADVDWKRAFNVIYWKLNWFAFLFFSFSACLFSSFERSASGFAFVKKQRVIWMKLVNFEFSNSNQQSLPFASFPNAFFALAISISASGKCESEGLELEIIFFHCSR